MTSVDLSTKSGLRLEDDRRFRTIHHEHRWSMRLVFVSVGPMEGKGDEETERPQNYSRRRCKERQREVDEIT